VLFYVLPWLLFVLGVIGTPIYLYRQRLAGQPWKINAFLATIAFILWAYTLDGSLFLIHHWYNVLLAGLLAPIPVARAAAVRSVRAWGTAPPVGAEGGG
jgi:hypothetical protein